MAPHVVHVWDAGRLLYRHAEQYEVGVAVRPALSGREYRLSVGEEAEVVGALPEKVEGVIALERVPVPAAGFGFVYPVGYAGGHGEKVVDGDGFGDIGVMKIQKFDYGGVEGEEAALDELERGYGGVCLADGGYAEPGIAAVRDVPGAVGESVGA